VVRKLRRPFGILKSFENKMRFRIAIRSQSLPVYLEGDTILINQRPICKKHQYQQPRVIKPPSSPSH